MNNWWFVSMFSLWFLVATLGSRLIKPSIPLGGVLPCLFAFLWLLSFGGIYALTEAFAEKLLPKIIVKEHLKSAEVIISIITGALFFWIIISLGGVFPE